MPVDIVGEKEIAGRLAVKENTVHQWRARGSLPTPDGLVSGNPAWLWSTIQNWAAETGRMPSVRDQILFLLSASPDGAGLTTPITRALVQRGAVGPLTSPSRVASVLTDLMEQGLVSIHIGNVWRITQEGLASLNGKPDDEGELARARVLYEGSLAEVTGREAGYYTEKRFRHSLVRYGRALAASRSLDVGICEELTLACDQLQEAHVLAWNPAVVAMEEGAYARLRDMLQILDTTRR